jgi:hypothetical protein
VNPPLYIGPGSLALCAKAHELRAAAKEAKTPLKQVAAEMGISRSTLRTWADAHEKMTTFAVQLAREGSPTMNVCMVVTPSGAGAAAIAVFREYPGTFKNLELPGWRMLVGEMSYPLEQVRAEATPRRAA